jgi:hypothetical protein
MRRVRNQAPHNVLTCLVVDEQLNFVAHSFSQSPCCPYRIGIIDVEKTFARIRISDR